MKRQYNNIDLFKFIFAIVVVMIHTTPFKDVSAPFSEYFSNTFANIAVPFFFVASGFLLFNRLSSCDRAETSTKVKSYVFRILKMYFVWCIFWIPFKLLNIYNLNFSPKAIIEYITNVLFYSGGDALWYLLALAVATAITYLLSLKIKSSSLVLGISVLFYLVGALLTNAYELVKDFKVVKLYYSFYSSCDNALFCAFVFVALGLFISQKKTFKSGTFYLFASIISFAVLVGETYLIKRAQVNFHGQFQQLSLLFVVYFVFSFILTLDIKKNFVLLRNYSTLIYLSHCIIIRCIGIISAFLSLKIHSVVMFIITLALSLAFSIVLHHLASQKKLRFLKKLY